MEPFLFLFWVGLIFAVPFGLIVASFVGIRRGVKPFPIICGCIMGIVVHVLVIAATFLPMFILVYSGAHTKPPGDSLNWNGEFLFFALELIYSFILISGGSVLAGRPSPWPIRLKPTDELR